MNHDTLILAHPAPSSHPLPFPLALTRGGLSGFPSPAQGYEGRTLDLNEWLVKRVASTFFMTVTGDSLLAMGMHEGVTLSRRIAR